MSPARQAGAPPRATRPITRPTHLARRLITAIALAALVGGCGGSGGDPVNTTAVTPSSEDSAASSTDAGSSQTGSTTTPDPAAAMLSRIRAAISDAAQTNSQTAPPLTAVAAWDASTRYTQGDVVHGLGANASHQYICFEASGNPTLGRPGPSGTGDAPIYDGHATWYYAGEVRSPTTRPGSLSNVQLARRASTCSKSSTTASGSASSVRSGSSPAGSPRSASTYPSLRSPSTPSSWAPGRY